MKEKIITPFFVFNPKSYLYGEELLKLAKVADEMASKTNYTVFVTAPYADLGSVKDNTNNVIVTAQHVDGIDPGRGMGHVLAESVFEAGARATFLNHAEKPMRFEEIISSVRKCNELGIITIVCANSIEEARAISTIKPDIILCEPTELIGTGQTSDEDYILQTNQAIKDISPDTLVMQAAGISNANDVYKVVKLGADGTGCTSGIIKAEDPSQMMRDMIESLSKAKGE